MALTATLSYIKARLGEGATWAGIGMAITSAVAIEDPVLRYGLIATGVLAALLPTSPHKPKGCE